MATGFEIPLTPNSQTFSISLSGVQYRITLKWNSFAQLWFLDFRDINNVDILLGVPVITGANLLEQYDYLQFGGEMYARTDDSPDTPPNFTNFGVTGHLYWVVP